MDVKLRYGPKMGASGIDHRHQGCGIRGRYELLCHSALDNCETTVKMLEESRNAVSEAVTQAPWMVLRGDQQMKWLLSCRTAESVADLR